ncbi:RNA recognition motif domain [Macleaya cordata]|uniref:RNA recognition motif domain n=1 Tax=Macleaya cordata TaxID=56857 RepID=A0A200PM87_MACCD|nr:RNA recognition motif domain [Macleaya cordata]
MSHFGRSGPPDIRDTYSLLVLNITFRTTADDLFPLFDKYGKVVDIFIPRDRRTGDSRGFAFVRYKYADEAQKAVEKLDGRNVDGRNMMVQFAKYGPNAEPIRKGRIVEKVSRTRGRSRSRSPRPRTCGWTDRPLMLDSLSLLGLARQLSTEMTTGTGIIEGEVVVEVGTDMIVTGIMEGKGIITVEAGARVQVLIIIKVVVETGIMMSEGVVDHSTVPLLIVAVLVLRGAHPHAGHLLLWVKVPVGAMMMNDPQLQEVFPHQLDLLILGAHLLAIRILMIDVRGLDASCVAVLQ